MKKLITIALIVLSAKAFSQSNADSIYFYRQSAGTIAHAQQNAAFLLGSGFLRTGFASIHFNTEGGSYRLAQQAQRSTEAGIYSEGINTFGRFKASGHFAFTRTWQDSLAWSTKGMEQEDQPYYFASSKAGKFERLNYDLGGILSYNLIKDKLFIASGVSYLYNSATRSVDPRPEVNTFRLQLSPEVVYHFKQQYLGVKGSWGYGDEDVSISYKNQDYNLSLGYPDRINYLVQGYGLVTIYQGTISMKRATKNYGFGVNYSLKADRLRLSASANYQNSNEDTYRRLASSLSRAYFGFYNTEQIDVSLLANKELPDADLQLAAAYSKQDSYDENTLLNAINYRYNRNQASLNLLYRWAKNNRTSPEAGFKVQYQHVDRKDFSTAHLISYSIAEPALVAGLYHTFNKTEKISAGLELGYRFAGNHSINVPTDQQSVFTKGVVFTDFSYYSSAAYKLAGQLQYLSGSVFKQFKAGFSGKFLYYRKAADGEIFPTATRVLGDNYLNFSLGLNLYF